MTASALVFTGPREVALEERPVESPGPDEVLVRSRVSAISPGTELLVYRGDAPTDLEADVSIDALEGDLSFPTRYGYATVGEVVETGPGAEGYHGERVFAFHPHQSRFCAGVPELFISPPDLDDEALALLPTAETATNLLLDGGPRVGERVVVFGAGVVGLATVRLLAELSLEELVVVEPLEGRRELARAFGADRTVPPGATGTFADSDPPGADLVYEVSGQPEALDAALSVAGYDGRVVVGSWYGSKRADLDLGGSFHRDRIGVTSSQVSTISPELRGRWSRERRRGTALDALRRIDTDRLVTDRVPFRSAPAAYERLDTDPERTLQVLLEYR